MRVQATTSRQVPGGCTLKALVTAIVAIIIFIVAAANLALIDFDLDHQRTQSYNEVTQTIRLFEE